MTPRARRWGAMLAAVLALVAVSAPVAAGLAGVGAGDTVERPTTTDAETTAPGAFATADPLNVTVGPVTDVGETTATVRGNLTGLGGAANATVYFRYWVAGDKENATTVGRRTCREPCEFQVNVSGLAPGTSYAVEAVAENASGDVSLQGTYLTTDRLGDVSGTVLFPNGTPAAGRFVFASPQVGEGNPIGTDYTDANGSFHVNDVSAGAEYEVAYYEVFDGNGTTRDTVPDVYLLANRDLGDETDLGTVELPRAYVLNTTVLDGRGQPVEGALVTYDHEREKGLSVTTNPRGMAQAGSNPVGLEVVGNVTMVVRPPRDAERFREAPLVRPITVSSRRNLTFSLVPVINVTTQGASVVNGSAVTFRAELGSFAEADSVRVRVEYWREGNRNGTPASTPARAETGPANYSSTVTGLEPDTTYVYRVVAETDAGVVVYGRNRTVTPSAGPPRVDGALAGPPTDLDGDGTYEDVNGNGGLDIGDVQALFANRASDVVRNNLGAFDFNGNGRFDIGDVQALFVEVDRA